MAFSITFIELFLWGLYLMMPIIFLLLSIISVLGLIVGRIESWNKFNSLYWALITALTVGYGDIRPLTRKSKALSIIIAMTGIIFTGLIVAMTVEMASIAFDKHVDADLLKIIAEEIIDGKAKNPDQALHHQ